MSKLDLEQLHFSRLFSKDHKAKYRCHLTCGVILGMISCMVGTFYGVSPLIYFGEATNGLTALIWIWE